MLEETQNIDVRVWNNDSQYNEIQLYKKYIEN